MLLACNVQDAVTVLMQVGPICRTGTQLDEVVPGGSLPCHHMFDGAPCKLTSSFASRAAHKLPFRALAHLALCVHLHGVFHEGDLRKVWLLCFSSDNDITVALHASGAILRDAAKPQDSATAVS